MYRQYENPYKVERLLHEAETALENAMLYEADNEALIFDLHIEINELRERLNFAWQDDEAEVEGYDF